MIQIKTAANSFAINDMWYPKGSIPIKETSNGIAFQGTSYLVSEIQCDGVVQSSKANLVTWINANLFKSGGGSGSGAVQSVTGTLVTGNSTNPVIDNPLLEFHRVIITDSSVRDITDFGGTITLVTNGIDPATIAQLNWKSITDETRKLTIIFTFDCTVTNTSESGVSTIRLPTSALNGDVWEVVWDKFYNIWNLVSVNNTASFDPVPDLAVDNFLVGSASGNIGRKIARGDLSLNNGQVLATNPTTGALVGINWSIAPTPNGIPVRTNGGNLQSGVSELEFDVVIKSELDEATTRTLVYSQLMPSGTPKITTPYMGVLAYITDGDDLQQVNLFALGGNPVTGQPILEDKHIPIYDSNGTLPIGDATDNNHAVTLSQLNEYAGNIIVKPTAGSTSAIYDGMKGKFIVSYEASGAASNIDLQSSNLSDIAGVEVIVINKSTDSNINVRSFSGQTQVKSSASAAASASVTVAFGTSKTFICDGVNLIGL